MRCGDCKYFSATLSPLSALRPVDGFGECRRNSPRGPIALGWMQKGSDGETHAAIVNAFPFVPEDDWCGDFKAKQS